MMLRWAGCALGRRFSSGNPAGIGMDMNKLCDHVLGSRALQKDDLVAVAMSGGVDSSVAMVLMQRILRWKTGSDKNLVGIYMRNWEPLDDATSPLENCPQEADYVDAKRVCDQLGVPLERVDFVNEYWNNVFDGFVDGYRNGITPNPDVACNREIKFKALTAHAHSSMGATYLATGHYASLAHHHIPQLSQASSDSDASTTAPPAAPDTAALPLYLCEGLDKNKDQSYFLSEVDLETLQSVLFPVGGMAKTEVRKVAADEKLVTATKGESMGICFVGKRRRFSDFLGQYIDGQRGDFISIEDGRIVTTKVRGVSRRVKERRYQEVLTMSNFVSMLITTLKPNAPISFPCGHTSLLPPLFAADAEHNQRWYVCAKNVQSNAVFVCPSSDHPALQFTSITSSSFHWILPQSHVPLFDGVTVSFRVRHLQPLGRGTVRLHQSNIGGDGGGGTATGVTVECLDAHTHVAHGQQLVLYYGDICLGGGSITSRETLWDSKHAPPLHRPSAHSLHSSPSE